MSRARSWARLATIALALSVRICASGLWGGSSAAAAAPGVVVRVDGNHLVNAEGQSVRLLGVDRSGTEYECEQARGIFDGPASNASIQAMVRWHVNAVRLPLNEGCWLDIYTTGNDAYDQGRNPSRFEGRAYRTAIAEYILRLNQHGMAVILDLSGVDTPYGLGVAPMADAQYSPLFWKSVARTFLGDPGILFDIYNEPHGVTWTCWLHGCSIKTPHGRYRSAGMQELVTAVRSTGAAQPIMLGGLDYASNDSYWLNYRPLDPDHSLVVSFHTYTNTYCDSASCWGATIAPLSAVVPVVTGELGEYDCAAQYVNRYMAFADANGISYLGWAWDAISPGGWRCSSPSLIEAYDGTPSPEGAALRDHLDYLTEIGQAPLTP